MIITLQPGIPAQQREQVQGFVSQLGFSTTAVSTQSGEYLVAIGSREVDLRQVHQCPGVKDVHRVTDVYKLVSRTWKVKPTQVDLGDGVCIGEGSHTVIAGPCSIEGEEQVAKTVDFLVAQGVKAMRGGTFKPRSSPYSFRGLGIEGLKMFASIAHAQKVKVVTEVLDASQIDAMLPHVDVFQVGARNSQNFSLLDELGKTRKPVLLKRGLSGTLEELLQSAEYIFSKGNDRIILCERGIRTYEKAYRNTLDLNAVPYLKEKSHLPVVVDPSHGVGIRRYVPNMAMAGLMAGADGCLLEVHESPEQALSDGAQTLSFAEAEALFRQLERLHEAREQLRLA
jgi:3-deoxy-7-phosphoheptulonate synthase